MGRGNSVLNQDGCAPINLDFGGGMVSDGRMDDATPPEDPIIALILAYCPSAIRPAWAWLFTFQKRINDGVARVGEPVLGQMRIAWWRDRIADADTLSVQRDPILLELAQLMTMHPALPEIAVRLLDSIERRITAETPMQWLDSVFDEGEVLALAFGQLANRSVTSAAVGNAFACARAIVGPIPLSPEQMALAIEKGMASLSQAHKVRLPRSLSLMRLYASQILANPNGPARRRDGIKLVIHGLTGWPKY